MSSPGPAPAAGRAKWPSNRRAPSDAMTTSSVWIMAQLFPQAGRFDDRVPALLLGFHVFAKFVRRATHRRDGLRIQRFRHFIRFERLVGRPRQLVDDRLRRAGG